MAYCERNDPHPMHGECPGRLRHAKGSKVIKSPEVSFTLNPGQSSPAIALDLVTKLKEKKLFHQEELRKIEISEQVLGALS